MLDIGIYPLALAYLFTANAPKITSVETEFAANGVEKDLNINAQVADVALTLSASFQRNLSNQATIVGDTGTIILPNFWMASEGRLYADEKEVEHFTSDKQGVGLHYEATAVGKALDKGLTEHPMMPLSTSYSLQQQIEMVRRHY